MAASDLPGRPLTVDSDNLVEEEAEAPTEIAQADPDVALADYAELARYLRAADTAGDRLAMAQIREQMDGVWPALTEEQRTRIEDGEFDW